MSKSQKVLMIFAALELVSALITGFAAVQTGGVSLWLRAIVSLLTVYLLFAAAKDASKISGAWIILLVILILSVLNLVLALFSGFAGDGKTAVAAYGIVIALNLAAFLAANNVKKQAK